MHKRYDFAQFAASAPHSARFDARQFAKDEDPKEVLDAYAKAAKASDMCFMPDLVMNHVSVSHPFALAERAVMRELGALLEHQYYGHEPAREFGVEASVYHEGTAVDGSQGKEVLKCMHIGYSNQPRARALHIEPLTYLNHSYQPVLHQEKDGRTWTDAQQFRWLSETARPFLVDTFKSVIDAYMKEPSQGGFGATGFRCDAAYQVPAKAWTPLTQYAASLMIHAKRPVHFLMETLGGARAQLNNLFGLGNENVKISAMNSAGYAQVGYTNLLDNINGWTINEIEALRAIGPHLGLFFSHDFREEDIANHLGVYHTQAGRLLATQMRIAFSTAMSGEGSFVVMGWQHYVDRDGANIWQPVVKDKQGRDALAIDPEDGKLKEIQYRGESSEISGYKPSEDLATFIHQLHNFIGVIADTIPIEAWGTDDIRIFDMNARTAHGQTTTHGMLAVQYRDNSNYDNSTTLLIPKKEGVQPDIEVIRHVFANNGHVPEANRLYVMDINAETLIPLSCYQNDDRDKTPMPTGPFVVCGVNQAAKIAESARHDVSFLDDGCPAITGAEAPLSQQVTSTAHHL